MAKQPATNRISAFEEYVCFRITYLCEMADTDRNSPTYGATQKGLYIKRVFAKNVEDAINTLRDSKPDPPIIEIASVGAANPPEALQDLVLPKEYIERLLSAAGSEVKAN